MVLDLGNLRVPERINSEKSRDSTQAAERIIWIFKVIQDLFDQIKLLMTSEPLTCLFINHFIITMFLIVHLFFLRVKVPQGGHCLFYSLYLIQSLRSQKPVTLPQQQQKALNTAEWNLYFKKVSFFPRSYENYQQYQVWFKTKALKDKTPSPMCWMVFQFYLYD